MEIIYAREIQSMSYAIANRHKEDAVREVYEQLLKEIDYQINNGLSIYEPKTIIAKANVGLVDEELFTEISKKYDVEKQLLKDRILNFSDLKDFIEYFEIALPSEIIANEVVTDWFSYTDEEPDISFIGMEDGALLFRCSNYTYYITSSESISLMFEHCDILNEVGRKVAMDYIKPIMDEIIERCNKYCLEEISSSIFEFDANVVNQELAIRFFSRDDVQAIYKRDNDLHQETIFEDGKDPAQQVIEVMTEYFENEGIRVKCLGQGRHYDSIKFDYHSYSYDLEKKGLIPYKPEKKMQKIKTKEEFEEILDKIRYGTVYEDIAQKLTSPLKEILKNADNPNDLGKVEITVKLSQAEFDFVDAINLDNLIRDFYEKSEDVKYIFDIA
jgi:hypothetical protein